MDAREFVTSFRVRGHERAYWRALEMVFGPNAAPVLRAMLLARNPQNGLTERERVARGLERILEYQAQAIEALARREAPVGEPRPLAAALSDMGAHGHLVHFGRPREEAGEALRFMEVALQRDAKVICLYPEAAVEALKGILGERGHGKALASDGLAFMPLDGFLEASKRDRSIETARDALGDAVHDALVEGYPEVWVSGHLAWCLFEGSYHKVNTEWEAYLHRLTEDSPVTVYCSYPETGNADWETMEGILLSHNWVAVGEEAYRLNLASS